MFASYAVFEELVWKLRIESDDVDFWGCWVIMGIVGMDVDFWGLW